MNILDRILELRAEKGWSEYKLSVKSEIPQSTYPLGSGSARSRLLQQ